MIIEITAPNAHVPILYSAIHGDNLVIVLERIHRLQESVAEFIILESNGIARHHRAFSLALLAEYISTIVACCVRE